MGIKYKQGCNNISNLRRRRIEKKTLNKSKTFDDGKR